MSNLEQLIKEVNKQFKFNIINTGVNYEKTPRLPFGSVRLNYMLYGGIPLGTLVEFSGAENSGKTTSALDLVASAQDLFPDKQVMYIDCENTFDPEWAALLGVDVPSLILLQPETETAEQLFEIALKFLNSGEISLMVIDSLGVMISSQAYEKTMEDKTYGGISMALTLFSKKAVQACKRTKCILLGINQMRDDMNSTYGAMTTTGGKAWKHNCIIRLQFRKGEYIDSKGVKLSRACENPAGNLVDCSIIKTKACRPDRKTGFYTLLYLEGIDYITDMIDVAVKEGLIGVAGAWYSILGTDGKTEWIEVDADNKELKFQGKAKLKQYLNDNPEWLTCITDKINLIIS